MEKTKKQIFRLTPQDDRNLEIVLAKEGVTKQDVYEAMVKEIIKGRGQFLKAILGL